VLLDRGQPRRHVLPLGAARQQVRRLRAHAQGNPQSLIPQRNRHACMYGIKDLQHANLRPSRVTAKRPGPRERMQKYMCQPRAFSEVARVSAMTSSGRNFSWLDSSERHLVRPPPPPPRSLPASSRLALPSLRSASC
jgi:hypothetical protein